MKSEPVQYMTRTRDFYRAQGFDRDYIWAHNETIPFSPLTKDLSACSVTVVTTGVTEVDVPKPLRQAASYRFADVPDALDTNDLAWDKDITHTRDRESYFPLKSLMSLVGDGVIGSIAPRYHFVPTEYSHRLTEEKDAPAVVSACLEDAVDIALLVPL